MAPHAKNDTVSNDEKPVLNGEKPAVNAQKTPRTGKGKGKGKGKGEAANKERLQRLDQL